MTTSTFRLSCATNKSFGRLPQALPHEAPSPEGASSSRNLFDMPQSELRWDAGSLPLLRDEDAPAKWGVRVAFSKRLGGVSRPPYDSLNMSPFIEDDPGDVARNHELFRGALPASALKFVKQVHGSTVLDAGFADPVTGEPCVLGEGDALIAERGEAGAIVVLAADCVPVLLAGPDRIAAVHAGWKGLAGGVIERAAESVGDVRAAWIGPSIRGCCYEVGDEVLEAFGAADLPREDESHVDPGRAAAVILRRTGVGDLTRSTDCTHCDETFFSYRRDGTCGRQAAAIAWV